MAQQTNKRIVKVKASTLAAFEGTFAAILGLGVAILHSLDTTVEMAESTDSVLTGLAFGLTTGIVSLVVLPFIYFGIGWVIGYVHGWIFNTVLGVSGGIVMDLRDE